MDFFYRLLPLVTKTIRYKYNILFHLLTVGVLYAGFVHFFNVVERPIDSERWSPTLLHWVTCLLLSLPLCAVKRRKSIIFYLLFLLDFYLIGNLLYYRTYFTLLPLDSFTMIGNLNGLGDSIMGSFRPGDIWFLIPTIALLVLYIFYFRQRIEPESLRSRVALSSVIVGVSALTIGLNLYICRNEEGNLLSEDNDFRYDMVEGASSFGFVHYWAWQVRSLMSAHHPITEKEKAEVENWLLHHRQTSAFGTTDSLNGKNVIMVIVESLESFPIGQKVDGKEITPNLNRLLATENCVYAPHVVPQVNGGHSSDAQLLFNAGMLPLHSGAACFRSTHNTLYTLAKALREKGYHSCTLEGGNASFWNQGVFNKVLGYDDLIAIDRFTDDESYDFGLSDSTFLAQASAKLAGFKQPFFAQLITLSSHDPYTLPDDRIYMQPPSGCPHDMGKYLNAIHYVDQCLGRFVAKLRENGLLQRSVLMITGDHHATKRQPEKWDAYAKRWNVRTGFTPLIIVNSGEKRVYTPYVGQIDIYPTLLDLFGLREYAWHGEGQSIFDAHKRAFAVNARLQQFGDAKSLSTEEIRQAFLAWHISDLMLTKDYFANI
jgi:phosphoglycerol transferase MdoB-like AlkP superfamily enzyme